MKASSAASFSNPDQVLSASKSSTIRNHSQRSYPAGDISGHIRNQKSTASMVSIKQTQPSRIATATGGISARNPTQHSTVENVVAKQLQQVQSSRKSTRKIDELNECIVSGIQNLNANKRVSKSTASEHYDNTHRIARKILSTPVVAAMTTTTGIFTFSLYLTYLTYIFYVFSVFVF
jgi:hypothetical protein